MGARECDEGMGIGIFGEVTEGCPEPVVTLIVPTFKRPTMLATCLRAIQAQTFTLFRVLVCDNSPEREGEAIVRSLQDPRFAYRPRPHNLGILGNVVAGFEEAGTALVMEVDDDDVLYPTCLARLAQPLLADPALAVSFSEIDAVGEDGRLLAPEVREHFLAAEQMSAEGPCRPIDDLAVTGRIYMVSALFRKELVDWRAIPAGVSTAYDRYVMMCVAEGDRSGYYVPDALVGYRIHEGGDALRHEAAQLQGALLALDLFKHRVSPSTRSVLTTEIARTRVMLCRAHAADRSFGAALRSLVPALTPRYLGAVTRLALARFHARGLRGVTFSLMRSRRRLTEIRDVASERRC